MCDKESSANSVGVNIVLSICAICVTFMTFVAGIQLFSTKTTLDRLETLSEETSRLHGESQTLLYQSVQRALYDKMTQELTLSLVSLKFNAGETKRAYLAWNESKKKLEHVLSIPDILCASGVSLEKHLKKLSIQSENERTVTDELNEARNGFERSFNAYTSEIQNVEQLLKLAVENHPRIYRISSAARKKFLNDFLEETRWAQLRSVSEFETPISNKIDAVDFRERYKELRAEVEKTTLVDIANDKYYTTALASYYYHFTGIQYYFSVPRLNYILDDHTYKGEDDFFENSLTLFDKSTLNKDHNWYYDLYLYYGIATHLARKASLAPKSPKSRERRGQSIAYYKKIIDGLRGVSSADEHYYGEVLREVAPVNLLELIVGVPYGENSLNVIDVRHLCEKMPEYSTPKYTFLFNFLANTRIILWKNENDKEVIQAITWFNSRIQQGNIEVFSNFSQSQLKLLLHSSEHKNKKGIKEIESILKEMDPSQWKHDIPKLQEVAVL